MGTWTDKHGNESEYYQCPKCGYKHYDPVSMESRVMMKYKSKPVHMFCTCGKDLGALS